MIHPTRTNLLMLKERMVSVTNSIGILKARRQAIIHEFMSAAAPLFENRDSISKLYAQAMRSFNLAAGKEGEDILCSIADASKREIEIEVVRENIWGLHYKSVKQKSPLVRTPDTRGSDFRFHSTSVDDATYHFERVVEAVIELAAHENKLEKLGKEIEKMTRRIRVLEEKVIPDVRSQIKYVVQYFSEREREQFYGLKMQKRKREKMENRHNPRPASILPDNG